MNNRVCPKKWPFKSSTLLMCSVLFLSACADKGVTRDLELDRYAQLENEIISAQEEEEQRRAAEYKVTQKLQQLDAERAELPLSGSRNRKLFMQNLKANLHPRMNSPQTIEHCPPHLSSPKLPSASLLTPTLRGSSKTTPALWMDQRCAPSFPHPSQFATVRWIRQSPSSWESPLYSSEPMPLLIQTL